MLNFLFAIFVIVVICAACVMLYIPIIDIIENRVTKPYMMRLICDKKGVYTIQVKMTRFSVWSDYCYIGKSDVVVAMDIFREKLKTEFQKAGVICKKKIK